MKPRLAHPRHTRQSEKRLLDKNGAKRSMSEKMLLGTVDFARCEML
jgi:hypothetical protein